VCSSGTAATSSGGSGGRSQTCADLWYDLNLKLHACDNPAFGSSGFCLHHLPDHEALWRREAMKVLMEIRDKLYHLG